MRYTAIIVLVLTTMGCGAQSPGLKQAPISVTGRISQAGQPVGNIAVSLQPLDKGHSAVLPVGADGTFQGQLISGTYAYFLAQSGAHSTEALRKIDSVYLQPDLQRTVRIEAGQEVLIVLD